MFIKFATTKIKDVISNDKQLKEFNKKYATSLELDLKNNIYLRNEAVHSLETYGPNQNGDAFPSDELKIRYHTFINSRVSLDHKEDKIVGKVLASVFVEPIKVKGQVVGGDFVENLLEINKEKAEEIFPGLIDKIVKGEITDTSMGAVCAYTICSVCDNTAYSEKQYCEHIKAGKMRKVKLATGEERLVYEICKGITFFEDSIIIPHYLGGQAGGFGADKDAKIKEIVLSSIQKFEEDLENLLINIPEIYHNKILNFLEKYADILKLNT